MNSMNLTSLAQSMLYEHFTTYSTRSGYNYIPPAGLYVLVIACAEDNYYELGAVLANSIIALYNSMMLFTLTLMYFYAIFTYYTIMLWPCYFAILTFLL